VTQYYLAGTNRVAMRKYTIPQSMSVEYMLSDHLNSTSLTTDANGAKVSEMRYKPWGELRYTWTSAPATTPAYKLPSYTFTGQYSYMDDPSTAAVTEGFGLMFYQSRWYDPALGRMAQADTMIPQSQGVQTWDRYAYVTNSPIRYNDPSGHTRVEDPGSRKGCSDPNYCDNGKPKFAKEGDSPSENIPNCSDLATFYCEEGTLTDVDIDNAVDHMWKQIVVDVFIGLVITDIAVGMTDGITKSV
jgi:RHS repeat-associated protein